MAKTFDKVSKGDNLYYVVISSENISDLLSSKLKMLVTEVTTEPSTQAESFSFDTHPLGEISGTLEEFFTTDGAEANTDSSILIISTTVEGFKKRLKDFVQSL